MKIFPLQRVFSQCLKELIQFKRDRLTLALALFLPLVSLLIFGFVIRLEAKNIPILIQDFDRSPISQSYSDRIFATNVFKPIPWDLNQSADQALDLGLVKAAVIIPPDFSRRITANQVSEVQILVDGSDANNARVIKNSLKATTNSFLQTQGLVPANQSIIARTRLWFNPGRQEALFIVPGAYAVVLWVFPSLLASIAMVREKEKGTILQIYASSLSSAELILGKAFAYLYVGLGMAFGVMGLGTVVFGIRLAGDPTPLLFSTPLYIGSSVMFGLLLGARANNQNAAVQGVALVGFLTALLLSGFIYPLNNIPFPLSLISSIVPARYFIEITRDAFVRGVGWSDVWFSVLMIFGIGVFFFNVARKILSHMQLLD